MASGDVLLVALEPGGGGVVEHQVDVELESLRVAFPAACGVKRSRQRARRLAHRCTRTAHRLFSEYPAPWGGDPLLKTSCQCATASYLLQVKFFHVFPRCLDQNADIVLPTEDLVIRGNVLWDFGRRFAQFEH